jgi:hypothetical protein
MLQDGEVEEFVRLPVAQVASMLVTSPPNEAFKTNCNLVRRGAYCVQHPACDSHQSVDGHLPMPDPPKACL